MLAHPSLPLLPLVVTRSLPQPLPLPLPLPKLLTLTL